MNLHFSSVLQHIAALRVSVFAPPDWRVIIQVQTEQYGPIDASRMGESRNYISIYPGFTDTFSLVFTLHSGVELPNYKFLPVSNILLIVIDPQVIIPDFFEFFL